MTESVYDPGRTFPYSNQAAHSLDNEPAQLSSLDELRLAVQQSEEVAAHEFDNIALYSPGGYVRLTCSTDLDQADFKRIQLSGIPTQYRKKRIPDIRKMDEAVVYAALIGRQTVEIAVLQPDGTYRTLEGTFEDPTLLAQLGAAEASVAVRRIFARDAYLLHAGQELQEACGYGERKPGEPGEDEDPT